MAPLPPPSLQDPYPPLAPGPLVQVVAERFEAMLWLNLCLPSLPGCFVLAVLWLRPLGSGPLAQVVAERSEAVLWLNLSLPAGAGSATLHLDNFSLTAYQAGQSSGF